MKKYLFFSLMILFLLAGCTSMEDMVKDSAGGILKDAVTSGTSSSGSSFQSVDFKDGEILAAANGSTREDASYKVAKVLTAASASTKNQGEFLFVVNGDKVWTPLFFETRIPVKNELKLGMQIFFCDWGRATSSDLTADKYRDSWWHVGRVTDVDELFKETIGINGSPYQLAAVRVPVPSWE